MSIQRTTHATTHELPRTFTDADGRQHTTRLFRPSDFDDLANMYARFRDSDRAQGVPPARTSDIRDWLTGLLDGEHVVVAYEGRIVGHAALLPCGDCKELLAFVDPMYRDAGVGTKLLETLLARHDRNANMPVRLSVERDNQPAIALYRKFGFEVCSRQRRELGMERRPQ